MFDYSLGASLHEKFVYAKPFPHVVIDNFISDISLLDKISYEFEQPQAWGYDPVAGDNMANKLFIPWKEQDISSLPQHTKSFLQSMNTTQTLIFLRDLTGIKNLFGDPFFAGGGMHRIFNGGKLSVHEDFAKHPNNKKWYRRLNLLLYLNRDWDEKWGGSLQLFDKRTKKVVHDIMPIFNRAVVFDTTKDALHGHPHPLNTPQNICRNSLALYYFTAEPPNDARSSLTAEWHQIDINGNLT